MADELEIIGAVSEPVDVPSDEVISPKDEVKEPEVDLVFDEAVADKWLSSTAFRKSNAYGSIVFVILDEKIKHFSRLLSFAVHAIKGDIKNRRGVVVGKGILYVPNKFANRPELEGLKRESKVGKFTAFSK